MDLVKRQTRKNQYSFTELIKKTRDRETKLNMTTDILPLIFIINPLNNELLPPTDRRRKVRDDKFCMRLSAENEPESELDEDTEME